MAAAMAAAAAAAASAVGPGAAAVARVSCGRDLSCVPEVAGTLGAVARQGFDFLCMPIFHPRYKREFFQEPAKKRPGPQTRSDLLLSGRDWNTLIVGKVSPWIRADSNVENVRRNSEAAMLEELNFGAYLGLPAFLIPLTQADNPNLARVLCNHINTGHHTSLFWMRVPLLAPEDLRDDVIENEAIQGLEEECAGEEKTWQWWHNFRTLCDYNKRVAVALEVGPDLPSNHVIDRWLGEPIKAAILPTSIFLTNKKGFPVLSKMHQRLLEVQFIITGAHHHPEKEFCSYLQYLEYLSQNRPPPSAYELFAKGYEDYLQSPLQPLMDNLESQTYEVFEKDPIKYSQYQQATHYQVVMVLGAGRGPLVNASLRAARQANRHIKIYAVEKNPNAVVTLESWQYEEWGSQVTVVSCDMREWEAPEKADLMLYNEVRACREKDRDPEAQFEMPYVVRLHNFHQLAPPKACFTFRHPSPGPVKDNNRYQTLEFQVDVNTVLHGFAGYFETTLYGDITLSIRPETHSPGMFSWFPIFFPIKQPMNIQAGEHIRVAFWRCSTTKKVWYEWAVVSPMCSVIHNPTGRSYTIGL
ncbi:hypothetical protein JD844_001023 [Phrynosoma platyrhinos]|uniref:Protein arginine N-methyltransferase 5 n=1 Tax=Phrynosoma platyrhinos TaxID=52577 RepID=A0ABQ7T8X2_PHRPL|nr:hypothetical protein JD844_001023 [Phrynosoma platyrhinos]